VVTGPLGQGIANGVGLAIAERNLAATCNTSAYEVFDNYTCVVCGDGCLQEGVSAEASSLAGHLGLGKLIVLCDDNSISIDGPTTLSFTEDLAMRYKAYGWHVSMVDDVNNLNELRKAIKVAQSVKDKPSIIKIKTAIGYGSKAVAGTNYAHGAPLGEEDLRATKEFYGVPTDKTFFVPDDVKAYCLEAAAAGQAMYEQWTDMFKGYTNDHPEKAAEIGRRFQNKVPADLFTHLPSLPKGEDKDKIELANMSTRALAAIALSSITSHFPELIGGSADLTLSVFPKYDGTNDFQKQTPQGKYIRFGVREHATIAVCNGLMAYGGMRPYCNAMLNFLGYGMGALRVSALSEFGVIFIATHDSLQVGEDGPTHQPIEMLESLRSMPNLLVYRPADANEMNAAFRVALSREKTPTVISCSRGPLKTMDASSVDKAQRGAYAVVEVEKPQLILISSGSEMELCIDGAKILQEEHGISVRVVSMPCQEIFLEQSEAYQMSVLPGDIPTLSVEASSVNGWHRFSHAQIGVSRFGACGKDKDVYREFGFSPENVALKGKALVAFYKEHDKPVPDLMHRPVFLNPTKIGNTSIFV